MARSKYNCDVVYLRHPPPPMPDDDILLVPDDEVDPIEHEIVFIHDESSPYEFTAPSLDEQIEREMIGEEFDPESLIEEEEEILAVNEFEIPDDTVAEVREGSEELAGSLRDLMLKRTSKLHMAYDIASAQVESVMRDSFFAEVSVDSEPLQMINCISDLELLNAFLENSSLSTELKQSLLAQFTEKFVAQTCEHMETSRKNAVKTAKFRSELENYKSRIGKGEDDEQHSTTNRVGSVALKSRK